MTSNLFQSRASNPAWACRAATVGDVPAINHLFAEVFGSTRDDATVAWRYFDNPSGPPVILVAEAHGQIISQCALWPTMLRYGGRRLLGAQSVDLMTHPAYRGEGIASGLAQRAYKRAAERGIQILFSFPNRETLRASTGLGWCVIGETDTYSRPLRSHALHRVPGILHPLMSVGLLAWPLARTGSWECANERPSPHELQEMTEIRNRVGACQWQTDHQPEWYDWRFAAEMGPYRWATLRRHQRIEAVAVWGLSSDRQSARIAEVIARSEHSLAAAMAHIVRDARAAGCVTVEAITNESSVRSALVRNGFRHVGTLPFRVRTIGGQPIPSLERFDSWKLFGSDFDVF